MQILKPFVYLRNSKMQSTQDSIHPKWEIIIFANWMQISKYWNDNCKFYAYVKFMQTKSMSESITPLHSYFTFNTHSFYTLVHWMHPLPLTAQLMLVKNHAQSRNSEIEIHSFISEQLNSLWFQNIHTQYTVSHYSPLILTLNT